MSLKQLQSEFDNAIQTQDAKQLEKVLVGFDNFCRSEIEVQSDIQQKEILIKKLIQTEKDWQSKILQLKSKVRDNIADIKSNGKKINKYLTSF